MTWAQEPLAMPAGNESAITSTTAPIFFGTNDAILPVRMGGDGGTGLFLYVTHNGGASWSLAPSFAPASFTNRFDFSSINDGVVWDGTSAFYATHNSGTSWSKVTPNVNFGEGLRMLDFVSTSTGWVYDTDANGNGAFYRTTDGGYTWTLLYGNQPTPTPTPTPTPNLNGLVTNVNLSFTSSGTSCSGTGIDINLNGSITTSGPALVTYHWEIMGDSVQWVSSNSTFPFADAMPQAVSYSWHAPCGSHAVQLIVTSPNEMKAQVNIPLYPPASSPADFAQTVVNMLNARDFNILPTMMDQTFGFAYWQSQGNSYPSDEAINSLRESFTVTLIPDASKDLTSLLGGLNPYAIMGLDPSRSYALFVSGWRTDPKAQAILYFTQRSDNSWYWHSVLVAPTGFIEQPTLIGPYAVINVAPGDVLNIRAGAGASQPVVGSFAPDAVSVMRTGPTASADNATWVEVQNPSGGTGWVNSFYLNEYVTHDAFCADTRIPILIEQLKGSMNQSNGDMLAGIVDPVHGVNVHLWAYGPAKNYSTTTARNVFSSTEIFAWGSGPAGGTEYGTGTFSQVIQPKLLDVFNAPNMETYCDNLTKVFPLSQPWPYTNVHYYNLYKPASGQTFDFRTWLIGFVYVNGQPFLHSLVSIVWEP